MKSLLWALFLLVQIHEHRGCIGEERMGLIELKAFLNSKNNYTNRLILPSWVNETKSECCGWEGVMCNTTTVLGIKTIFLELVRCKNEEEQVKEKFTRHKNLRGSPLKATSTELQRSFTIK